MYFASPEYLSYIDSSITRTPCSKVVVDGVEYSGRTHLKTYPKISHSNTKMIGGFPAATCEFEIYNIDGTIELNGKEVEVYKGLEINGAVSWIPMGIFSATDDNITNNKTARSITFKGYDRAALFDVAFVQEDDITFPCTLLNFVEKLCARRGVQLENNGFPMASFVIEAAPNIPSNFTERQLVSCAAELGGCVARINRSGKLEISKPYLTGRRISRTRYSAVSKEPAFGPINSVVLGHEGYNDDIVYPETAPDNLCEWRIEDNPFVENRRKELITDIAANIIGMSFIPFKITDCVEDYIFDVNDSVEIESKDGTVFTATILSKTTSSRIRSELKAETQKSSTTNRKIAGSMKEAIKRVQLDVDHQNNRINALVEDSVSRAEIEVLSKEINIRFDEIEAPDTVENVTNAVTIINKDGVSIKNGALTLIDDDGKTLIGVNTDENGDMYVSGNIKARSVEANSVDADAIQSGAITADKLSVGEAKLENMYYNGDFSASITHALGWEGFASAVSRNSSGALVLYLNEGANLISEETSEFFSISDWNTSGCSIRKPYVSVDYIELTPTSADEFAEIVTPIKLEKGKRYSISAQINPLSWSQVSSSRETECMGIVLGDQLGTYQVYQNFTPKSGENNVEWVFDYKGESGTANVGLYFIGMKDANGNAIRINIAWVAVSESSRDVGFYTSYEKWLKDEGNNIERFWINGGSYINSASLYLAYVSTDKTGVHQIFSQKAYLERGKRYVFASKLKLTNYSNLGSTPVFGAWAQDYGAAISPEQFNASGIDNKDTVIKVVFDYNGESAITDVGLVWKHLLNSSGLPCMVQFYWVFLAQDDNAELGFFSTNSNWLKDDYKISNLLPEKNNAADYVLKSSLEVASNKLYFYGTIKGSHGSIGCLSFDNKQLQVNNSSYYFTDLTSGILAGEETFMSTIKIIKPNSVLDYMSDSPSDDASDKLMSYQYLSMELTGYSDFFGNVSAILTPYALGLSDGDGKKIYVRAGGISSDGKKWLTPKQIQYLAENTPEA